MLLKKSVKRSPTGCNSLLVHLIDFFNGVNSCSLNVQQCLVCCLGSWIAHKRDKNKEKEVAGAVKVSLQLFVTICDIRVAQIWGK